MNWHTQEDLPERNKPKREVKWNEHHALILRAIYWHRRTGTPCTDQSIWNLIVRGNKAKDISPSGARTRRHELAEDFKMVKQGTITGRTESGRSCSTYLLTKDGIKRAQAEYEAAKQMKLNTERVAA